MLQTRNISDNNNKSKLNTPTRILQELFKYYRGREMAVIQLAYKKGATQVEIAEALNVDQSVISKNYPKGAAK